MDGPKRRVNKYGKAGRRTLVHDLFDVTSQPGTLYTAFRPSAVESLVSSRGESPFSQTSEDPEVSSQLNHELLTEWDSTKSRLRSPARKTVSTGTRAQMPTSMFEIESSDEEPIQKRPLPKAYKRRKVTPTGSDAETKDRRGRAQRPPPAGDNNNHEQRTPRRTVDQPGPHKAPRSGSDETRSRLDKMKRQSPKKSAGIQPLALSRPSTPPRQASPDAHSPASDVSFASMVTTRSAIKRKREATDGPASDVSSPSGLELSSLRLSPRRMEHPKSRSRSSEPMNQEGAMTSPPRIRRRLIDRLEAASSRRAGEHAGTSSVSRRPVKDRESDSEPSRIASDVRDASFESPRKLEREDSHKQTDVVKPRKYGKQRSHLRDVGTGNSHGSGSQSLDDLVSQVDALPNSQPSQFDLEMSDGDDDGLHLKSIHELRQAGAVNRFDRDLDSLLEDIASPTKSLRISGLMQLVRKLKEQAFKRHLLDHGKVGKLIGLITADIDIISASIMLLAFWTLAHSESATGHILSQLYGSILALPAGLMWENRSLTKIAQDRTENLSKALIRDLADFEGHVLDQSASAGRQTNQIIISRIVIRAIEVMLRRVASLGEDTAPTPKPWLEAAITSIQNHLVAAKGATSATAPEHVESIRLILAWLELSEATSGATGATLSDKQVSEFGKALTEVLIWAGKENVTIEHSCLKLAIEMSNHKGSVSRILAGAGFSDGAFAIVEVHFPMLADKAVKGFLKGDGHEHADKLSSIILALGSLLDFVDNSEEVRLKMTDSRNGQGSQVDQLIKLFRLYVDETDEAIDESKTAILIPFGYISLLLCTLSLNDEIRKHISATIGRSFTDVVDRTEIFLERMRGINPDAAFVERFVERFSTTIESVKARSRA